MKYIELSTSKKARICRALGVSRVTLWSALTFQTQSTLAEKIRRMAVQNGGRVMIKLDVTEGFMPNCEMVSCILKRIVMPLSRKVLPDY